MNKYSDFICHSPRVNTMTVEGQCVIDTKIATCLSS